MCYLVAKEVEQEAAKPVGVYRPPGAAAAYRPPGMRQAAGAASRNRAPEISSEIAFPSLQQATAASKRFVLK